MNNGIRFMTTALVSASAATAIASGCAVGASNDDDGTDLGFQPDAAAVGTARPTKDASAPKDSGAGSTDSSSPSADASTPEADAAAPVDSGPRDSGSTADIGVGDSGMVDSGGGVSTGTCSNPRVNYPALLNTVPNAKKGTLGSCSSADIATARAKLPNVQTLNDLATLFTGTCKACATQEFTANEAQTAHPWAVFNFFRDANGAIDGYLVNHEGSCVATRSTPTNAACGKALGGYAACENVACASCATSADITACQNKANDANTGTCGTQSIADVNAKCTQANIALLNAGAVCGPRAADVTQGDVWVTSVAGACGAP
jgi:hypothetical protein